jgi:hypothetical protein
LVTPLTPASTGDAAIAAMALPQRTLHDKVLNILLSLAFF